MLITLLTSILILVNSGLFVLLVNRVSREQAYTRISPLTFPDIQTRKKFKDLFAFYNPSSFVSVVEVKPQIYYKANVTV